MNTHKPGARVECSSCGHPPSYHVDPAGHCPGAHFAIAWLVRDDVTPTRTRTHDTSSRTRA